MHYKIYISRSLRFYPYLPRVSKTRALDGVQRKFEWRTPSMPPRPLRGFMAPYWIGTRWHDARIIWAMASRDGRPNCENRSLIIIFRSSLDSRSLSRFVSKLRLDKRFFIVIYSLNIRICSSRIININYHSIYKHKSTSFYH